MVFVAHVTRWEPYDIHDLVQISSVGSVIYSLDGYRSSATYHYGRSWMYYCRLSSFDHDLSEA